MKYLYLATLSMALLVSTSLQAQQVPAWSHYMLNPYLLNPAASNLERAVEIHAAYRSQWSGYTEAPESYYVSVGLNLSGLGSDGGSSSLLDSTGVHHIPTSLRHIGTALVMNDSWGAFNHSKLSLSYSLHLPLTDALYVGAGIGGTLRQSSFDGSSTSVYQPEDPLYERFISGAANGVVGDAMTGFFLRSKSLFVSYGWNNLFRFNNADRSGVSNSLDRRAHHSLLAQYSRYCSPKLVLAAGSALHYSRNSPMRSDFYLRGEVSKRYEFVLNYRSFSSLGLTAGATIYNWLRLSFTYEFVIGAWPSVGTSSQEVLLSLWPTI